MGVRVWFGDRFRQTAVRFFLKDLYVFQVQNDGGLADVVVLAEPSAKRRTCGGPKLFEF